MFIELVYIFKKNYVRYFNYFCIKNLLYCSILKWYRICVLILIVFFGVDFFDFLVVFYVYNYNYGVFFYLFSYIIFVFDFIKINDGNGYNNSDGIFMVWRIGVYVFYWLVMIDNDFWVSVELVVNEILIGCVVVEI